MRCARIADAARPRIARDAVRDRVLDDRLQHERGNARRQRIGVGVDVDVQAIGEADALDLQVAFDELQLVGERRLLPAGLVEAGSEDVAQQPDDAHDRGLVAFHRQH